MTLERLKRVQPGQREPKVEKNLNQMNQRQKVKFNQFLGNTGKLMNEVDIPNPVQRLTAKAKASDGNYKLL